MGLRNILLELRKFTGYVEDGVLPILCRILLPIYNYFEWAILFDITIHGIVIETVQFTIIFPTSYPFEPPRLKTTHPEYKHLLICIDQDSWSPAGGVLSIISHIYFSITNNDYYEESLQSGKNDTLKTSPQLNASSEFHPTRPWRDTSKFVEVKEIEKF